MRNLLLVGCVICISAGSLAAQRSADDQLTRSIAEVDAAFFAAYDRCDLEEMRAFFIAGDVEFYHDQAGLTTSVDEVMAATERNICGKIRRELEPGSLEVWPVKGYGAIETGAHRFYHVAKDGQPETGGTVLARFLHIWKQADGKWKLTRVVSYAH